MAHKVDDRALETSTAPGVGAMVLNGAVGGDTQSFAAFLSNGDTTFITAVNGSGRATGNATYASANNSLTFIVDVDFRSSNANAIVNFSGTVSVFCQVGAVTSDFMFHPKPPGGRLTLTTGVPVLTATVSAAGTVYYALYTHNQVPLYNGTAWTNKVIAELSNVLANSATGKAGPAAVTTNSNYDLFVWNDAGTVRLTRGPLWTSGTARGTGAGTTELVRVEGVWLNAVAITNGPAAQRGTYVGTIRTNGSSLVDFIFGASAAGGTAAVFGVWNAYNRRQITTTVTDSGATWATATSSTARNLNSSATNRISFISGLAEDGLDVGLFTCTLLANAVGAAGLAGFGLDATAFDKKGIAQANSLANLIIPISCRNGYAPQLGFHFIQATDGGDGTNAATIFGATNEGLVLNWQN